MFGIKEFYFDYKKKMNDEIINNKFTTVHIYLNSIIK